MTESENVSERPRDEHSLEKSSTAESETETEQDCCPDCGGSLVYNESQAELHCDRCGIIVDADGIDRGPEWRAFDSTERDRKSRVGAPATEMLHDRGMSTKIGWENKDSYGNRLSQRKRQQLNRLRTWDERFRATDSKDRNLKQALGEIDRMASALGLPENVRETAGVTYRRALEEELLPGRSIEGMATAALYAATRMGGVTRSIDEVSAVSRVETLEVKRSYRYLSRELELEIEPTNPKQFIGRLASKLDCTDETEHLARELLDDAIDQAVHSGKHPMGMAASALYGAGKLANDGMTQDDVSAVANVSKVTIRNRYREIMEAAAPTR